MLSFDLSKQEPEKTAAYRLGHAYCVKFAVIPVKLEEDVLYIAMKEPSDFSAIKNIEDLTGLFVIPMQATGHDVRFFANKLFGEKTMSGIESQFLVSERLKDSKNSNDTLSQISSVPAVRFIDSLIEQAVVARASDIHIEPLEHKLRARYRVDGILQCFANIDISVLPNAIGRIKVMAGLDISEKRLPQEGHFTLQVLSENIEFRISTLPTVLGEKVAIRLLYDHANMLKKQDLGFFDDDLFVLNEVFNRPYGAVFITGPTGSGKSTTMSSFLSELNSIEQNIITIEDPVENPLPGISHINIKETPGMTFASALKFILRQDPDIIMIGEIRDEETARIATQAALTGHVVLSTIHTNDAAGVIERLMDMNIEPYLIAAVLNGVISQRLVRRICENCKTKININDRQQIILGIDSDVFIGKGCSNCFNTGYKGRFVVYEYIILDKEQRQDIAHNPTQYAKIMRSKKMLYKNIIKRVLRGDTSAEEAIRILGSEV